MIREIRLLIEHKGTLRKICKLAFVKEDASFYVFPYARSGRYFLGGTELPEQQEQHTFDFTENAVFSTSIPKLSIHQSGQVHIRMPTGDAGPLRIPQLPLLNGQHVASVSVDTFDGLMVHERLPSLEGKNRDIVVTTDGIVASCVLAIYVNGNTRNFCAANIHTVVTIKRPTLRTPLYIGLKLRAQHPLGQIEQRQGVTVIAGWNPLQASSDKVDYLYIRGE